MPIAGRGDSDSRGWVRTRDEECARAGREPTEIEISVYAAPQDPARLIDLAETGVDRVMFGLPPEGRETVLPLLDHLAGLASRISDG